MLRPRLVEIVGWTYPAGALDERQATVWAMNVVSLLRLGVLKNDDMTGLMLQPDVLVDRRDVLAEVRMKELNGEIVRKPDPCAAWDPCATCGKVAESARAHTYYSITYCN